ncbi:MAG: helix-turn-helix domain-containing protein [Clostridiales bacterium]|nr:helix-turn-helix domain-containing protein [Clostridiales bacterium]
MKSRRKELGIPVDTVAAALGVSVATVYRYESGEIEKVPGTILEPLAKVLHTTPAYLMGWTAEHQSIQYPSNIMPLPAMKEWPVLGATACGKPLHREMLDETVMAPVDIKADIVFRCVGDSMINARIFDGDTVFIHLQPEVENGQIAVIRIGDEYTLKRVYVFDHYVELRSENPTVKPIILRGPELEPDSFEVVGLAVAFMSAIL